jgi:hypothetical protein
MLMERRPQRREAEIRAEFGTWTRGITGLETWGLTRRRGGAEEEAEKTVGKIKTRARRQRRFRGFATRL